MSTITKTAAKSLDCPLCKQKEVIELEKTAYRFGPHAQKCPMLRKIYQDYKVGLLKAKILGENYKELFGDNLTIDDYQKLLNNEGFEIKAEIFRKPNELHPHISYWHCRMYITDCGSAFGSERDTHYPEVTARYPDDAFNLLRHFLICGETIRIDYTHHVNVWRWDPDKRCLVNLGEHEKYGEEGKRGL
jgi:hypothetical protein